MKKSELLNGLQEEYQQWQAFLDQFDHFHDDHEPDMRAWLARVEKQ
jgi:hypothetical protein